MGDPHAKPNNLDEMKPLILFASQLAQDHKVDRIEILGDLFHTHNVVRLEVLEFWCWALDLLSKICETVVLEGNHDQSGNYNSDFSSISVFSLMNKKNLIIVDEAKQLGVFGYVPYMHNPDDFIHAARNLSDLGAKVLVCHQTIEGSKYESGIYAPDGIPTGEWSDKFTHVISGHIHSTQAFSNIVYPGTARWDGVVDANLSKGLWIFDHEDSTGKIIRSEQISSEEVCRPIKLVEWREGDPEAVWNQEGADVTVELIGSSVWVTSMKEKLKGHCKIKTKITDVQKKDSRKAGLDLSDFIKNLFVTTMDRGSLLELAKEYGIV